jgi:hypothetical protein
MNGFHQTNCVHIKKLIEDVQIVKDVIAMVPEYIGEVPDCPDQETCPFFPDLSKLDLFEVRKLQFLPVGIPLAAMQHCSLDKRASRISWAVIRVTIHLDRDKYAFWRAVAARRSMH